jgi:hypothetical protein
MTNKELLENVAWTFMHYKTFDFKTEEEKQRAYEAYKKYKDEAMKRMNGE